MEIKNVASRAVGALLPLAIITIAPRVCAAETKNSAAIREIRDRGFIAPTVYSTDGRPKARGMKLRLLIPEDWIVTESREPHVVSVLTPPPSAQPANVALQLLLKITKFDRQLTSSESRLVMQPANANEMVPPGAELLDVKQTSVDGAAGLNLLLEWQWPVDGQTIHARSRMLTFIEGYYAVTLTFNSYGTGSTSSATLESSMAPWSDYIQGMYSGIKFDVPGR